MASLPLELPDAIVDAASIASALDHMRQAQSAIDRLSDQITVFHLAELFEENPGLLSFSFSLSRESDDEGGSYLCAHAQAQTEDNLEEDELDDLHYEIEEWIGEQTNDWKRAMKGKILGRPSGSESLIEALMRQCLSPRSLAVWQAAVIASAAGPAQAPSPSSKSI